MTVDEQIDELDAILSEYFTWKGEAIHLINQTQNYKRMKQAIKKLLLSARLDELEHIGTGDGILWSSDIPLNDRIDQLNKEVNSL